MINAIEINSLHKSYGKSEVLKGLDLSVAQGSLFSLLGPNGAGKTTIVSILSTLIGFDAGTVQVFGHDVIKEADAVRSRIALTGQYASLDEELTGLENLVLIARLQGYSWKDAKERAHELLDDFDLAEASKRLVKNYSGGMRRRLDIATSIIVTPDLLVLDEPTTGLDPRSRRYIWDVIHDLHRSGTTVLLTTQYLEEADALADRVVIIDEGKIKADGTPGELKSSIGTNILRIRLSHADQRQIAEQIVVTSLGNHPHYEADPTILSTMVSDPTQLPKMFTTLSRANIIPIEFSLEQPSLDEVFLTLTGVASSEKPDNKELA